MKVFWVCILVLVLVAGVLVLREFRSGGGAQVVGVQATAEAVDAGASGNDIEPTPMPPVDEAEPAAETEAVSEPEDDPIVVDIGVADDTSEAVELQGEPAPLAEDVAVKSTPSEPDAAATFMLNSLYLIPGSGTDADPYIIGFDMLVALEQDYAPETEGKGIVPEWIKPLDGKVVTITGFIGFPFISPQADECMVMLNQWDGCCIGIPPSLYDAVEVQLAEPIDLQNGVINYGTLTGVFRTDPYLVNGWLIGLYVMDEARLESGGSKNQAGF